MNLLTGASLLILALPMAVPDLDPEEKAFVGQCIEKLLNGKSDRVRRGAEDALVAIGVDVIDELSAKSGDGAWKALEKLCARIGARASVERLESLAESTKDATRKGKLSALAAKLKESVPGSAVNAGLAARINALLAPLRTANSFSSNDPVVDTLVELGHDAVPILLTHLKPGDRRGMVGNAVEAALKRLAVPEDLPSLKESLHRGNSETASAIGELLKGGLKEALKVLHDAVAKGIFGHRVTAALESSPEPADTARVVAQWFKSRPTAAEHDVAFAAELLGKLGVLEAAEALVPWIAKAKDQQTVYHLGMAMALLGESKGIPLLIRIVAGEGFAEGRFFDWCRPHAARELNEISGKSLDVANERISGEATPEQERSLAAAGKEYKAWWESAKGKLKFDKSTRQWSTK